MFLAAPSIADTLNGAVKLPMWRDAALAGLLTPTIPPIFTQDDFTRTADIPQYWAESESGGNWVAGTPGYWALKMYGVPFANVAYFVDPGQLYTLGSGSSPPDSFFFGIKAGKDQGYLYKYQRDPTTGNWFPVGTTGLIGGRGGAFDTNAFIRSSNKLAAITVIAMITGGYAAFAAEGAAAGAAAEGVQAADVAGGLIPEYGSIPAYNAGIGLEAGAVIPTGVETVAPVGAIPAGETDLFAGGISTGQGSGIPGGEGLLQTAGGPVTETALSTSTAWDTLISKAKDAAGNYAQGRLVNAIRQQISPTKPPASGAGVAGTFRLPDGSLARVNPDGSISIIDSHGGSQTIGADGSVSNQWIAGVPNSALAIGGALLLSLLLLR